MSYHILQFFRRSLCVAALLAGLAWCGPARCGEIQEAAKAGDLAKVTALVKANPKLVSSKDDEGKTALHWAAANDRKEVAQFLLDNKADAHATDNDGETPLDLAAFHKDMAELLRKNGGGGRKTNSHDPQIFRAASEGDLAKVKELVEEDPDEVFNKTEDLCTPLDYAAEQGHAEVVTYLLDHRADIEFKNSQNETPLMDAAYLGHPDVVKLLLDRGAKINEVNTNKMQADTVHGMTALHFAASMGRQDVVEALLGYKPDVNAMDQYGQTPLHYAVMAGWGGPEEGYKAVALLLLANGGNIEAKDGGGRTPLHVAALGGKTAMAELLIAKGADVNAKDKKGKTPLRDALDQGIKGKAVADLLSKHGGTE